MFDLLTLSTVLFLIILLVWIYYDRRNIEFHYILMLRRTKRGLKYIDRVAKSNPKFWNFVGLISIPVALIFMLAGLVLMLFIAGTIISGEQQSPALAFVLPSLSPREEIGLGGFAYFLPFWFYFVVVATLLIPHEVLHGIIARAMKIPLKSAGWLLLLVFVGAFVEPDEKKVKKSKTLAKLKVFSAGVFANFLTALVLVLLLGFVFRPLVVESIGMRIYNITENSPAYFSDLKINMTLEEINGTRFNPNSDNPLRDVIEKQNLKPGDKIDMKSGNKTVSLVLGRNPENSSKAYMGITSYPVLTGTKHLGINSVLAISNYGSKLIFFLLIVAAINSLPWKPFDGGRIFEAMMEKISRKHAERISNFVTMLVAVLFLFNMFGPDLMKFLA